MQVILKVLEGNSAGQEIKIPGNKFFIGRAEDCHLRPKSDLISRHHCVLLLEESFVAIRDFGSKNGTLVNGERVLGERELKNGDLLQVGMLKFEVQFTQTLGGAKKSKVKDVAEAAARTVSKAGSSDVQEDVAEWLKMDETANVNETRPIQLEPTAMHETMASSDTLAGDTMPLHEAEEPTGPQKKTVPGKLPAIPSRSTKDSRDAAAETLRKLFKGR